MRGGDTFCPTCGLKMTQFRWNKRVKKLTAKGEMRWTRIVKHGTRCDRGCREMTPEIPRLVLTPSTPVSKGRGDLSSSKKVGDQRFFKDFP